MKLDNFVKILIIRFKRKQVMICLVDKLADCFKLHSPILLALRQGMVSNGANVNGEWFLSELSITTLNKKAYM
jgi:hypothetical protein